VRLAAALAGERRRLLERAGGVAHLCAQARGLLLLLL
jgi:hypothetical protein